MTPTIRPPRRMPGTSDTERLRELEIWAETLTAQLSIILTSISEENLTEALRHKINNKSEE